MNTNISEVLNADPSLWNDWHWQMKQKPVCSDPEQLVALGLVNLGTVKQRRRVGLTPYNLKLLLDLRDNDPEGFKAEHLQTFPLLSDFKKKHQWVWAKRHDLLRSRLLSQLPIPAFLKTLFGGRGSDTETHALECFYPRTDVLIAAGSCARHCTFCFREIGDAEGEAVQMTGGMDTIMKAVQQVIDRKTPHVLITGGDPLTRSNDQLRQILEPLVKSDTVQVIRLATRMVVDLPMRFYDNTLLGLLEDLAKQMRNRQASLRIVVHVNHVCELTSEAVRAIRNIQACGIEVLSQTAALHGVNDEAERMRKLFLELDRLGVRVYKLFHSMPVHGTEHLRVSVSDFRKLIAALHQWLPGTSVPQANIVTLVGKVPVSPSRRWIVPIPFTDRMLCRSFRGEWYFFKDAKDLKRHIREVGISFVAAALILMATILTRRSGSLPVSHKESQVVSRISVLANEMDYPDAWARQRFTPFVQNETLYLPLHGL